MNFSFNISSSNSSNQNNVKNEIDLFKLNVEADERYLSNFEIFKDDSLFMCYVDDNEIEIKYENNKISHIECYNNEEVNDALKNHIDATKSIYDNLISLNSYFYIYYQQKKEEDDDEEEEDDDDKSNSSKVIVSNLSGSRRSRLGKLIETDLETEILKSEMESDDDSDSESAIERMFTQKDEDEYTKESKPIKFEANLDPIKFIIDLTDNIILNDNSETDNYIPSKVIDASIKIGKPSTVYQIVNEINNAIKNTKNINIKATENVFNILIENKFKDHIFEYSICIPINFPYTPPILVIKSNYNQSFSYALNNCEILNSSKWNPSTTIKDIIVGIYNNVETFDVSLLKNTITDVKFAELTTKLLQLSNTEPLNSKKFNLNFNFLKIQDKSTNRGIGYDQDPNIQWSIEKHMKEQEIKLETITKLLSLIIPLIKENSQHIGDTCLIPYLTQYIYGVSILEVVKNKEYYTNLFKLFHEIYNVKIYNDKFNLEKISSQKNSLKEFTEIFNCLSDIKFEKVDIISKSKYIDELKDHVFDSAEIISSGRFKFMDQTKTKFVSNENTTRIMREFSTLSDNLSETINEDSSIFFRYDEANTTIMKFLIIPQPDTPYAYGCFEFDMYLKSDFPNTPPHVEIITTGGGKFRFNPNLYDNGKVCLSLLGTWSGKEGESWTSSSTILQVLLSIQSIIFCEEPYFNEPGYERERGTEKGKIISNKYNEPVRFHTLMLAMVNQLKSPSFGFETVIKTHFKLMQDKIYKKLDEWKEIAVNKVAFEQQYTELKKLISNL
jgi:ubiquitin-protein ligase